MSKIGVLALQGAYEEHIKALRELGVAASTIRLPAELEGLDGLIIPGGESTTVLHLLAHFSLLEPLRAKIRHGLPVFGTCAGMICLAKEVSNSHRLGADLIGMMDIKVERNAFGRQVDSFEEDITVDVLGDEPFHAIFIRAPRITEVKPPATVLAVSSAGDIVAVRQGNLLTTAFHPELTPDLRLHRYFLCIVKGNS